MSESELEDLLSLDDIVLDDVFQYHLPPVRRIPPLLWTRIRSDLPNYLTERDANGVNAMNWYHKQFREASIQRYFDNQSNTLYFHSSIADYYLGIWGGGQQKPFKYTTSQMEKFNLTEEEGSADRKVPAQPLAYFSSDGRLTRYNMRKLAVLPFHLIRAKRFNDLLKKVLFDYNWLNSKLSSFALQTILFDFEDSINHMSTQFDANVVKEISLLADTLKLSAPIITQYPNMFAPQILARLLPLRNTCPNINRLLRQCDLKGPSHCALLPVNHCLHTPGGPLMYSLEGHHFAVFDLALTSDNRYIISVSNRFLMWDLSTGEVSLDIDPNIRGIMFSVILTDGDRYAVSYTNYNEIIVLNIISNEIHRIGSTQTEFDNNIIGMGLAWDGIHLIAWTSNQWIVFNIKLIDKMSENNIIEYSDNSLDTNISLVMIEYVSQWERHMIYQIKENQFSLQTIMRSKSFLPISFMNAFALNKSRTILFVGNLENQVCYHRRRRSRWSSGKLFSKDDNESGDQLLSLRVCKSKFLVAFHLRGFRIWTIDSLPLSQNSIYLRLPTDCCNISIEALKCHNPIVFSKSNHFAIAGVRKSFYIWSMKSSDLLKSLDAHFARITQIKSLIVDNLDAIVSSSFDKTIKVWNIKNVFEKIHTIDRMELSIDSIGFCESKDIVLTVTRNSIGIWSLDSGQLLTTLCDSKIGAIVTQAIITSDSNHVISIESNHLLIWRLDTQTVIFREPQINVKDITVCQNDSKLITIQKLVDDIDRKNILLTAKAVPSGQTLFEISFDSNIRSERLVVITKDDKYLVIPMTDTNHKEVLGVYRLEDGLLLHSIETEKIKFNELVCLRYRGKDTVVGLIGFDKSYIIDVYTKRIIAEIKRWNGQISSDGHYGLFAPSRGGLELIDLKFGSTVKVLLPQTSEGVINFITDFTSDDNYVFYYHSIKKNIRFVFE